MATYTQTVTAKQGAALTATYPNTRDYTSAVFVMDRTINLNNNDAYAVFSFNEFPTQYRKKKINGVSIKFNLKIEGTSSDYVGFEKIDKPFQQETVGYYDFAGGYFNIYDAAYAGPTFQWWETAIPVQIYSTLVSKEHVLSLFQNGIKAFTTITSITSIKSQNSSEPPYVYLEMEDYVPKIKSVTPNSGFINEQKDNVFTWSLEDVLSYDTIGQSSAVFRWKSEGDPTYNEIPVNGSTQSVTVPAGTFNAEKIQWQVVVTSDDGIEGTPSDWYTLTTVDSTSSAKAVSPVNVVVDGSYPVDFRWNHVIDTGSDQTKYEIEYSEDNGLEWKPLKSEETPNTFATIPENTLPAGNLLWKVRTYNSDGVAGNWSEPAGFIVRAAPQAPSITSISAEARPTVRWQSVGQEAYEIAVYSGETLLYTTGETAGTEKQKKIPEYLAPGTYTVQIRIWNAYNIESPWSSGTVQIPENVLTPPGITATTRPGVVEIQISGTGYEKYYLLRDGVPIAKILSGSYRDYAVSAGTHSYVARGVTAEDAFADSEPQEVTVSLPYAVIAPADNLAAWTPLIYRRNSEPSWTENLQSMGQAVFVAGRKKPFFESAEYWNNVLSFAFSYRTREEYDALRELLLDGKTVRYRGKDGTAYWMVITGLQTTMDYLSKDFTLSAQEVDYVEKIEYDTEES